MRVVLDTNILLVCIPKISKYRIIFEKIINEEIQIVVSNEIFTEYLEVFSLKFGSQISNNILSYLNLKDNILKTEIHYKYNLITQDPDDNKFIDAYLNSNSDYLVTNDKHFNFIKNLQHPEVKIINIDEFIKILIEKTKI
jgi:putative PIN family toxin of toxin-antitoxin system